MRKLAVALAVVVGISLMAASLVEAQPEPKEKAPTTKAASKAASSLPAKTATKSEPKPSASSEAPAEPKDVGEAIELGKKAVEAAKGGLWWYFSALVIMVLMFLAKFIGTKMGWWVKLGRWRYVIVPVLSIVAALLAAFQGGVTMAVAIGVLGSSMATGKLQELWEHGIMGKPHGGSSSST